MGQPPRNMTDHMLTPLRHFWNGSHLITNGAVDATEESLSEYQAIPGGRCMHLTNATGSNELPTAKLGCTGNAKVPVWLYRASDSYSAGFPGPDPATYVGPSWDVGVEQRLLMFVGLEGFELATTEFDTTQTYQVGEYLRAGEDGEALADTDAADQQDDIRNFAGVVTNKSRADAALTHGAHTIIGIVSPGFASPQAAADGTDEYGNQVLSLYTTYRPPVAGLTAAAAANNAVAP